jgi:hypothetical protein
MPKYKTINDSILSVLGWVGCAIPDNRRSQAMHRGICDQQL